MRDSTFVHNSIDYTGHGEYASNNRTQLREEVEEGLDSCQNVTKNQCGKGGTVPSRTTTLIGEMS